MIVSTVAPEIVSLYSESCLALGLFFWSDKSKAGFCSIILTSGRRPPILHSPEARFVNVRTQSGAYLAWLKARDDQLRGDGGGGNFEALPQSTPTSPCQRPSKGLQGYYSQNKGSTNSSLKWPQGKGPQ
jgi:hypothetical protein